MKFRRVPQQYLAAIFTDYRGTVMTLVFVILLSEMLINDVSAKHIFQRRHERAATYPCNKPTGTMKVRIHGLQLTVMEMQGILRSTSTSPSCPNAEYVEKHHRRRHRAAPESTAPMTFPMISARGVMDQDCAVMFVLMVKEA